MKKLLKFCLCICIMLIAVYLIYDHYKYHTIQISDDYISKHDDDFELISDLRKKYNNNEITMFLELPGVFSLPIVQTENNTYYLSHNINKEESSSGSPYLDYRNKSLHDRKLIIYGHNRLDMTLPLSSLIKYQNKNFFDNHKTIFLRSDHGKKTYDVFSVFNDDGKSEDYLELSGFPGLEFYEHLLSLKEKSIYDTEVSIEENSKVIILRTCAIESGCGENPQYQVVVAKEVNHKIND